MEKLTEAKITANYIINEFARLPDHPFDPYFIKIHAIPDDCKEIVYKFCKIVDVQQLNNTLLLSLAFIPTILLGSFFSKHSLFLT